MHRSHRAFGSRQELLDYEAALCHAGQLTDALEVSGALGRLFSWCAAWHTVMQGHLGPLTMPVHCPCHTIQLQANDVEAAEQALQPAWAALDANVHKQERDGTPAFLRQFDAGRRGT